MKFRFLVDNKTEDSKCLAEWGLSILIETEGKTILFDTGASPIFAANAKALGVDLSKVDALVISHGHFDHTEGVPAFVEINSTAPIYIHKEAFYETHGVDESGSIEDYNCGILWNDSFKNKIAGRIIATENIVKLYDNITIVGNIPNIKGYEPTETFFRKTVTTASDGSQEIVYTPDPMNHEQFLVVEEQRGLFVFSGCCHKGVVPTIRRVQELLPGKKIAGFIAGMHLYPLTGEQRQAIAEEIAALDMDCVFPVHCTGIDGILRLKALMGDKCVAACAGDSYEY